MEQSIKLVVNVFHCQKQKGTADCGMFAIVNATALTYGKTPASCKKHESTFNWQF